MRHTLFVAMLAICTALAFGPAAATAQQNRQEDERRQRVPTAVEATKQQRLEILMRHGVGEDTGSMVRFLERGFPREATPGGLPRHPLLKSEVISMAMMTLGDRRGQEAVPVLERIAKRDNPAGVRAIIDQDFEQVPMEGRAEQVALMERALSLNAIAALGHIGDERAAPTVLEVMRKESGTAFTTRGAMALGRMGRSDGLPAVVLLASDYESNDSAEAFRTIYYLTGRNYGYNEFTAMARRRVLVQQLNEWFEKEGKDVEVRRTDVQRRSQAPPRREAIDPTSLRGALRESMNMRSFDARYEARVVLERIAEDRFDDLRAIVEDPYEDLDIRRAAMTWLGAVDARRARSIIRRQRNDENETIAEFARSMERDLDEAIAFERRR